MSATVDPSNSAGQRLRWLEVVTDAGLAQLSVDRLLDELLDRVCGLMAVDTAAVLLLDPSQQFLMATVARGIEEEVNQGVRIPLAGALPGGSPNNGTGSRSNRLITTTCSTRSCGKKASPPCWASRWWPREACWAFYTWGP